MALRRKHAASQGEAGAVWLGRGPARRACTQGGSGRPARRSGDSRHQGLCTIPGTRSVERSSRVVVGTNRTLRPDRKTRKRLMAGTCRTTLTPSANDVQWGMIVRRRHILTLVLFLQACRQAPPMPPMPRIGIIDFYGVRTIPIATLRQALGLREGDTVNVSTADMLARIKRTPGVHDAAIANVCCDSTLRLIIWVGVQEQDAPAIAWAPTPIGAVHFPAKITKINADFWNAMMEGVEKGEAGEDDSLGYSVFQYAPARAIQLKLITWAPGHLAEVRDVLHHAKDPEQRALAATLIAYTPDRASVIPDLVAAVRDPSSSVRNDATRALGVLAMYAGAHPDAHLVVPVAGFVDMMNSLEWTDRNKASFVLMALTQRRDPRLLAELRAKALDALIDMARWKSLGHAMPAVIILRRIAGMPEATSMADLQENREAIIAAARASRSLTRRHAAPPAPTIWASVNFDFLTTRPWGNLPCRPRSRRETGCQESKQNHDPQNQHTEPQEVTCYTQDVAEGLIPLDKVIVELTRFRGEVASWSFTPPRTSCARR